MRILGIDPGTGITGWGIIDKDPMTNNGYKVIDYGVIRTSTGLDMPMRLKDLHDELDGIIKRYKPDEVGVEDLFFFKNQKTVIKVGQARGVIILTAVNNNLPVFDYTPLQVKQSITGYGRAEKKQVQRMVKMVLGLKTIPKPDDAADALAVAICHTNTAIYSK